MGHNDQKQIYFVLQGCGIIQIGEETIQIEAGNTIFLPAKIPHGFVNNTDKLTILSMIGAKI